MPIYKPSELRSFLSGLGIFPKKGLSQNFLIDGNIIRKIIATADVQENDVVLEVGPGPGSLTQALLATGAKVIAVEKDEVLAKALNRLQTDSQSLSIFSQDILSFDVEKEIVPFLRDEKKVKIIANLPYHLTTPILSYFIPMRNYFSSLTVMVQEEVGRRITAQPGTAEYSSFTLFIHFYTQPKYAFTVSRNCFYPIPKVDSAILSLQLREPPLKEDEAVSFFKLTRTAFEHRRKMLRASLKALFSAEKIEDALKILGQNPLARPENLSLDEFIQFYFLLKLEEKK